MINFLVALFLSVIASFIYVDYAKKNNIFALVNERSLHKTPVITGAGIVLGFSFFIIFLLNFNEKFLFFENKNITMIFFLSFIFSIFGWYDDKLDISAVTKMIFQILVTITFASLYVNSTINDVNLFIQLAIIILITFLLAVSINCFNFMDGINGLALSLALYILISLVILDQNILIKQEIIFLTATLLTLMTFNLKNKFFIGDAGSVSLGFFIGAILLNEMIVKNISFITVAILVAYWASDCACTFLIRFFVVKNWYKSHKSHPYQQLTKLLDSQIKVFIIINFINIFYLFPLAYLSQIYADLSILFLLMAYTPNIIFALKYGPYKVVKV